MVSVNRTAAAILSAVLAAASPAGSAWAQSASAKPDGKPAIIAIDDDRIKLAEIELRQATTSKPSAAHPGSVSCLCVKGFSLRYRKILVASLDRFFATPRSILPEAATVPIL